MPHVILGMDTSTERTIVVLAARDERHVIMIGSAEVDAPRAAMSRVLVLVEDLLNENKLRPERIGEIFVGRGPGSFTGVRIGVATAKGLAQGLRVPLHGVGTLDAIAWRFVGEERLIGVVGDAMRGEVYPALFRYEEGRIVRLTQDVVADPVDAAHEWRQHRGAIVLAGNGLVKHGGVFGEALGEEAISPSESWAPDGWGLLSAYAASVGEDRRGAGDPGALLPVYTRLSDAEENERAKAGHPRLAPPGSGVAGGDA